MSNLLIIAKKELQDMISNKIVILTIIIYLLYVIDLMFHQQYINYRFGMSLNPVIVLLGTFATILVKFGSLFAIVIGFISMYSEFSHKTINTLITKPVYRDQIINGKLLGISIFFIGFLGLTACVFLLLSLYLFPSYISGPTFTDLVSKMPIAIVFSSLIMIFFLASSMLFTLTMRNETLAMFASFLLWVVMMCIINNVDFAGNISMALANDDSITNYIASFSPDAIMVTVFWNITDVFGTFSSHSSELVKLVIYALVMITLCYISFLRRDIQ